MKQCAEFSLIAEWVCVEKTRVTAIFLPLINNSVTVGLRVYLLCKSAVISSYTINILSLTAYQYQSKSFYFNLV